MISQHNTQRSHNPYGAFTGKNSGVFSGCESEQLILIQRNIQEEVKHSLCCHDKTGRPSCFVSIVWRQHDLICVWRAGRSFFVHTPTKLCCSGFVFTPPKISQVTKAARFVHNTHLSVCQQPCLCLHTQVMKPQEAELVGEISKVLISQPGSVKERRLISDLILHFLRFWIKSVFSALNSFMTPAALSATMHGLRAEDGLQQRSAGAQSDPTRRLVPEGGAGGEQEELPEESSAHGGAGGVAEGETWVWCWDDSTRNNLNKLKNSLGFLLIPAGRTWSDAVPDPAAVQ